MSLEAVLCGPCMYTKNNINAFKWCIDCEEGFCKDCEKVHRSSRRSRNHNLISTEDYKKLAGVTIGQTCQDHKKRLELYCRTHDEPLCAICVPTNHQACSGIVGLEDVVTNAKGSTALADLEETLDGMLRNLIYNIGDRESILKDIEKQEQLVKEKINVLRKNLNIHLDKLQNNLLLELTKISKSCRAKTKRELSFFESMTNQFNQLKNEMLQLKKFSSDLQVFLGTRQINRTVTDHVKTVKSAIATAKNYKTDVQINPKLNSLLDVHEFGKIQLIESDSMLTFKEANIERAQIHIANFQSVNNTRLQLKYKFQIKKQSSDVWISGGIILPNGHMIIADHYGKNYLLEYNDNGEHVRDIRASRQPYDLTAMDSDLIAVSYNSQYIAIINMNKAAEKKIELGNDCRGISYQDGKLYVVVTNKGIVVLNVTGELLDTIRCDVSHVDYIKISKDKIYYTDYEKDSVHCCTKKGEQIWVFKDQSVVYPMAISVDNYQNVFVVGQWSKNLTLVQHDGTVSKTLLTDSDGLDCPRIVYFDKSKKVLFVCDKRSGEAALYDVY